MRSSENMTAQGSTEALEVVVGANEAKQAVATLVPVLHRFVERGAFRVVPAVGWDLGGCCGSCGRRGWWHLVGSTP